MAERISVLSVRPNHWYGGGRQIEAPDFLISLSPAQWDVFEHLRDELDKITRTQRQRYSQMGVRVMLPKDAYDSIAVRARLASDVVAVLRSTPHARLSSSAFLGGWIAGVSLQGVMRLNERISALAGMAGVLEPWLRGELPVRHRPTYERFHLDLSPEARWVCSLAGGELSRLAGQDPSIEHMARALTSEGWLERRENWPNPGSTMYDAGPLLAKRMSLNEYAWWRAVSWLG